MAKPDSGTATAMARRDANPALGAGFGEVDSSGEVESSVEVAAVVLAAGGSSRFGSRPKQLATLPTLPACGGEDPGSETLVHRTCRIALEAGLFPVVLVLGHGSPEVRRATADLQVLAIENLDWQSGQASSVRHGLEAVPEQNEGAMFLPCDQPLLDAATLRLIAQRFRSLPDRRSSIVVPCHQGRRGAPALFGRDLFPELATIEGDEGGRQLLRSHSASVSEVELRGEGPLLDADTPEALARLSATLAGKASA